MGAAGRVAMIPAWYVLLVAAAAGYVIHLPGGIWP
jgi:hypothetical protein